ncbi:BON domain-containing protein [Colwellia psychrerythraea]|uniref:Putative transport protein n=1 Tax=Colwellia psychrerythraea (strain 34H / ATCC BAA-681) TaxID=167879 RepID=Q47VT9_COLP3|nr:BON domain-containing protein [Colwellia psychrerythraea]AAZ27082.1 putative transport protein [Colwellia psychrerythraea 34H]
MLILKNGLSALANKKTARIAGLLMLASALQGCAVATVVAVTAGATMVADRRTFSKQIDDQSIEFIAHNELNKQKALSNNTNLHVISMNGTVLVIGQAPNSYLRDLAIKTIQDVPDIVTIHNQVRIGSTTALSTQSNDIWLTSKVKSALLTNGEVNAKDIKVVTENSEVFLLGLVTKKEANIVVEITRNINGVSRVFKAFEYI